MNDFASLPWYVRHGSVAAFFAVLGIADHGALAGAVVFVLCLFVTLAIQVALDGFDPSRW